MTITLNTGFLKNESGVAAVEFSLLAPILIFMVVMLIDFGTYINQRMRVEEAARVAAQFVFQGGEEANIVQDILPRTALGRSQDIDLAQDVTIETATICECANGVVTSCSGNCPAGDYLRRFIEVNLTTSYTPIFSYPGIDSGDMAMTGTARFQFE